MSHDGVFCRYSTFVVKYSWAFLLLGLVICLALGLSAIFSRDLPDFNDPTKVNLCIRSNINNGIFLQGFVPRGKNTLTSRLFVLERVKKELERQIAATKLQNKRNLSSLTTTTTTTTFLGKQDAEDNDDDDSDYDDNFLESDFIDDLKSNANTCAFSSNNDQDCLSNTQVYRLIDNRSDFLRFSKQIEQKISKPNEQSCTSIDLNRHYEVYFESSNRSSLNLLTIENLRSLCTKQNKLLEVFQLNSTCHYTLPQMISYFVNKSNCFDLNSKDIQLFINRIQRCHRLYDTGLIRTAGLKRYRLKPLELLEYDFCFRYNLTFLTLEYLLDKNFLSTNQTRYTAMWFLKPTNSKKVFQEHTANSAYDLFIRHFYRNPKFDDGWTRISALNFLDIRISTAMKQIRADMFFVILAISLIVSVSDHHSQQG